MHPEPEARAAPAGWVKGGKGRQQGSEPPASPGGQDSDTESSLSWVGREGAWASPHPSPAQKPEPGQEGDRAVTGTELTLQSCPQHCRQQGGRATSHEGLRRGHPAFLSEPALGSKHIPGLQGKGDSSLLSLHTLPKPLPLERPEREGSHSQPLPGAKEQAFWETRRRFMGMFLGVDLQG